ncbi:MAG TPA: small ribosomal subunit Rsm22 family protein [Xanthobacteraceae bacterium]|nr:small ribosomal subunit Rsm22 family protein [Xanthobacteraceae bacterium]
MELPPALRAGVDALLDGVPLAALADAAATLSRRYRAEIRDGRLHLADDLAARAYLATRLPATYAALHASLDAVAAARPDFAPRSLLDVGAGPGSALWAARAVWPRMDDALLVEASGSIRAAGERLSADLPGVTSNVTWRAGDIAAGLPDCGPPRDLVTLGYVLDELAPEVRDRLIVRLWDLTAGLLVIVEPGTPAGWRRILAARDILIAAGGHVVAPCPHQVPCPVAPPDWCHFSRRVARSRLHRQAKGGEVPWEDEKFSYLAVARESAARRPGAATSPAARVLAPPRAGSGRVMLKLCRPDGTLTEMLFTRRDGAAFKLARRADWGDAVPEG